MAIKFIDFFLCLNSLNALTIEIWIVALSFVGLIISILGVIFIPWDVTSSVFQILFIIGLIFIALSMVVSLIIIYLRIHHNLKRRILRILILALLIVILICLISLIIFIIVAFGTISDLDNTITKTIEEVIEETGEVQNTITTEERICTKTEKAITITISKDNIKIFNILLFNLW
jgi:glucan phosphoethanolaminetransferase (alkaline phosphatase superfamily)